MASGQQLTNSTGSNAPARGPAKTAEYFLVTNSAGVVSQTNRLPALPRREIVLTDGAAIADYAPHKVVFAADLKTEGAIEVTTPEGRVLRSHVMGLGYFDSASGRSVLLAETQESIGEVLPSGQVLYRDAFDDLKANVLYTYRDTHFVQDIYLLQRPPSPAEYGLDPNTTRLEVLTEFLDPPPPVKASRVIEFRVAKDASAAPVAAVDDELDFGTMRITSGTAFSVGGPSARQPVPVAKNWLKLEGRDFLIEAVDYPSLQPHLDSLTAAVPSGSTPRGRAAGSQPPAVFARASAGGTHRSVARPGLGSLGARAGGGARLHSLQHIPTAGLKLWVRSDAGITASGSSVSQWADQSGQGNHFTQGEGDSQPSFLTNSVNGRPVVRFDGDDDWMDTALAIPAATMPSVTIYTVERVRAINPNTNHWNSIWSTDGEEPEGGGYQRGRGFSGAGYFGVQQGYGVYYPGLGPASNTVRIVGIIYTDADTLVFINGTNYAAGAPNEAEGAFPLRIGAGYIEGSSFQCSAVDLAEVLVYNRALTGAERAQLENALNDRYAVFPTPAPAPTLSPAGGDYVGPISVTVTSALAGATYQLSTTGALWTNYTGPVTVSNTATLLARTLKSGYAASAVTVHHYRFVGLTNLAIPTNGLKLHLRADTGVVFDGERVSEWRDQSGEGNDAAQLLSTAYQPLYLTNGINGQPVLRFDGADDQMDTPLAIPTQRLSQRDPLHRGAAAVGSLHDYSTVWSTDGEIGEWQRGYGYWSNEFVVQLGPWNPALIEPNIWRPGLDAATNTVRIVGVTYTDSDTRVFVDGVGYQTNKANIGSGAEPLRLGAGYEFSPQNAAVDLAEVLVYDRALSTEERGQLEQALRTKYLDTDGDGLPDDWEVSHFGSIALYGAADDPDGDGWSNLQEYLNGTNPNAVDQPFLVRITSPRGGALLP